MSKASYVSEFEQIADVVFMFEEKWTPERPFSIEDALILAPKREAARLELFTQLLEIDMTRGFETKAPVLKAEYVRRFPQWEQTIESTAKKIARDFENVPSSRIGERVGDYRIDELLGQGGTGCVYKAFDLSFKRFVAIKFLKTDDKQKEERLRLFKREMATMGSIPPGSGVAQAYSCGQKDGVIYFAMEFVDGIDLQRYFKNVDGRRENAGALPWREAIDYVTQIAYGLITIHDLGIVHRDVKPANAMLDSQGKIHILDLGFADFYDLSQGECENESESKMIAGTRAFLPPEARNGQKALDAQSDLYCLGGTCLYLLTGLVPSQWFDPFSKEPPTPLRDFLRKHKVELPDKVVGVLARLLEPDREKRYKTARDAWRDLNALIAPEHILRKLAFAASLIICVALAVFVTFKLTFVPEPDDQTLLTEAVDAYERNQYAQAFELTSEIESPNLLSPADQFDFWTIRTCGYVDQSKYDEASEALANASMIPSEERSPVRDFEARALEVQIMVIQGEETFKENPGVGKPILKETIENTVAFLAEHAELTDAQIKEETKSTAAAFYYWRARAILALKGFQNVEMVVADLEDCLKQDPNFYEAQKLYGDSRRVQAQKAKTQEFQKFYAREATQIYQSSIKSSRCDVNTEKCAALRKTILLYEFLEDRQAQLDVCGQLLKIDSKEKTARRYYGKSLLVEELRSSSQNADPSKKARILDALCDVAEYEDYPFGEDYLSGESDETSDKIGRGEIWFEIALASMKLEPVSRENCETCVDAIENALEANRNEKVYVFNDVEWNVLELRQAAKKKLECFESNEERYDVEQHTKDAVWKEAEAAYEAGNR